MGGGAQTKVPGPDHGSDRPGPCFTISKPLGGCGSDSRTSHPRGQCGDDHGHQCQRIPLNHHPRDREEARAPPNGTGWPELTPAPVLPGWAALGKWPDYSVSQSPPRLDGWTAPPSGIGVRVPEEHVVCRMSPNAMSRPSNLRRGHLLPLVPHLPNWLLAGPSFTGCGDS